MSASILALSTAAVSGLVAYHLSSNSVHMDGPAPVHVVAGEVVDGLKDITLAEVAQHKTAKDGIWVVYKNGVYDVTSFVAIHPGGDKLLLAAGGAVDPYWDVYASHKKEYVYEMLEEMRIGNVAVQDRNKTAPKPSGAYANEPTRHPAFRVHSPTPFNAETPNVLLADTYITPNELFFVRNHLPVPVIDPKTYKITVSGPGLRTTTLTLEDLKTKFKQYEVTATIQCAGNRRADMNTPSKPVKGSMWGAGAIGNAVWSGVRLRDVLLHCGLPLDEDGQPPKEIQHVHFEGYDVDLTGEAYASSIPVTKAINPLGDVLLALSMNGQELPRDHGYPIRVVIPGIIGGRAIKWLGSITTAPEESKGFFQQKDYKSFSPSVNPDKVDFKSAPAMQEFPIQSAITSHTSGASIQEDQGSVLLKGFAWSGGGRKIIRVDVSIDGGHTWQDAVLNEDAVKQPMGRAWAWTPWTLSVDIPTNHKGSIEVVVKAVDESYNSQPERSDAIWNPRGLFNNAWHRVVLNIIKGE
jgi:sulfite oxidase